MIFGVDVGMHWLGWVLDPCQSGLNPRDTGRTTASISLYRIPTVDSATSRHTCISVSLF
jgi:hypothetical protein